MTPDTFNLKNYTFFNSELFEAKDLYFHIVDLVSYKNINKQNKSTRPLVEKNWKLGFLWGQRDPLSTLKVSPIL